MATRTLPGADYRGFDYRLGIQLPDLSRTNVSVRCFADPGAHRREDRNPSRSVNTVNGHGSATAAARKEARSTPPSRKATTLGARSS